MEQEGDPAGGGGGGAGVGTAPGTPPTPPPAAGDPPPGDPAEPKFSDKDMAAMRRKHERELKIQQQEKAALEVRLAALENPAPPPTPPSDPADKAAGELEILQARHAREMDQAKNDAAEARKIAEDERKMRRNVERDRSLENAMMLSGVAEKAKPYATTYFRERIVWDKVDDCWVYKTKIGNLVDITDGVGEEMPDMFKRPAATRGGAGTQSGLPPSRARVSAQLDEARATLELLKAKGGKDTANVLAFTKQLRVVAQLEAKVNAT